MTSIKPKKYIYKDDAGGEIDQQLLYDTIYSQICHLSAIGGDIPDSEIRKMVDAKVHHILSSYIQMAVTQ